MTPAIRRGHYFKLVETLEKVVLRLEPSAATVAMMATEMPAAISPYSIAVAPCSLLRKLKNKPRSFMTGSSPIEIAPFAYAMLWVRASSARR